jgi:BirA family biotin operon repressor/biotin-[acetyl-CoA-carboxylase] ligase
MRSPSIDLLRALGAHGPQPRAALAAACRLRKADLERCLARLGANGFVATDGELVGLTAPFDFLDAAAIAAGLGERVPRVRVEVLDACPSTSTALMRETAAPLLRLLLTEEQVQGRGRRGRRWLSCVGAGIAMSLRCVFSRGVRELAALPLAAGVAAARALRSLGAADAALKWPNDLLVRGAKLGGILAETRTHDGRVLAVIGIGINCRSTPALEGRLGHRVAALEEFVAPCPSRNVVAARVADELLDAMDAFDAAGLASFKDEWEALHAYAGQRLRVRLADGRVLAGIADGLAEDGGLRLRTRSGVRAVKSGRVVSARVA